MTQIYLSQARHADHFLRLALGAAQIPTDDLGGPDQMFFSLSDDEGLIGFIGLECNGADRVHLVNSGTGEFFRRLGYVNADRNTAPAFSAATAQFTSLCGPRATNLVKDLK